MLQLALLSLATWRLTALLVYEDGPRDIIVRLRNLSDVMGGPLTCFWCTSGWVSLAFSILTAQMMGYRNFMMWWFASWAVAVLIDEVRWAYFPPEECDAETEEGEAEETPDDTGDHP